MGTSTDKTANEHRARSRAQVRRSKASLDQFGEGARAVRDRVLCVRLHLAEGDAVTIGDEHGIVTKALGAARWPDQTAMDLALKDFGVIVGPGKGKRAGKVSFVGRARYRGHLLVDQAHGDAEIL